MLINIKDENEPAKIVCGGPDRRNVSKSVLQSRDWVGPDIHIDTLKITAQTFHRSAFIYQRDRGPFPAKSLNH